MERAAKEGLAPVQLESVADRLAIARDVDRFAIAQETDRLAIAQDPGRSVIAQDIDRVAIASNDDASRYCPVCSQRLESRRCKLICPVCGYYMSCADYY